MDPCESLLGVFRKELVVGKSRCKTEEEAEKQQGEEEGPSAVSVSIEDAPFADDSTLLGRKNELMEGKEVVKKSMLSMEEKCHDEKEEHPMFATNEGDSSRVLEARPADGD